VVVIDAQAPVLAAGGALVALAVDGSEVPLVTTADADDGRLGAPAVVTTTALVGADVGVAISVEGGADYQTLRAACASAPLATGGPGAASEGARRPPTPVGRGERPVAVGLAGVLRRLAASRQAEEVVVLAARPTDSLALSRVDLGLRRRLGGSARLTVALELRDLAARGGELTLELQVTADQAPLGAAATVRLPPAPDGEQRLEAVMSLTDSELAQLAASVEPELRIRVLPAG
jgi:hypothetical protein